MSARALTGPEASPILTRPVHLPEAGSRPLPYSEKSAEHRLLENDPEMLGSVFRWISAVLASPRFWSLRSQWADLLQDSVARVIESLREGRFDPSRNFQAYVQGVARYTALQAL